MKIMMASFDKKINLVAAGLDSHFFKDLKIFIKKSQLEKYTFFLLHKKNNFEKKV